LADLVQAEIVHITQIGDAVALRQTLSCCHGTREGWYSNGRCHGSKPPGWRG